MTREEQIWAEAEKYQDTTADAFCAGAVWADSTTMAKIEKFIEIQKSSTPNDDPYFVGMTNGMICLKAILGGDEPVYEECPKP